MRGILILFMLRSISVYSQSLDIRQIPPTPVSTTILSSPQSNQVAQGIVPITLNSALTEVRNLELSFAYVNDPTDTWFLIFQSNQPSVTNNLATWDTTNISDGNYNLRLVIEYLDGNQDIVLIQGLRVRNYSPIETVTPAPPAETLSTEAVSNPSSTPTGKVTPSPAVPSGLASQSDTMILTITDVIQGLWQGVLTAVVLFVAFGTYKFLRRLFIAR